MRATTRSFILALTLLLITLAGCTAPVNLHGKRVALLVDERYLHVYAKATIEAVEKHGGTVVVVAPQVGLVTAMDEPRQTIEAEVAIGDVDPSDFHALVIPGGFSGERLVKSAEALSLIRHFHRQRKLIAGICAGTGVMAHAGVLEGIKATGTASSTIEAGGGVYVPGPVSVSDLVITSQSSGMEEFNRTLIEVLGKAR
jgi:protease I